MRLLVAGREVGERMVKYGCTQRLSREKPMDLKHSKLPPKPERLEIFSWGTAKGGIIVASQKSGVFGLFGVGRA